MLPRLFPLSPFVTVKQVFLKPWLCSQLHCFCIEGPSHISMINGKHLSIKIYLKPHNGVLCIQEFQQIKSHNHILTETNKKIFHAYSGADLGFVKGGGANSRLGRGVQSTLP